MSDYKIIEEESRVMIGDKDYLMIRVFIDLDNPNTKINLKFMNNIVMDFFCDVNLLDEKNQTEAKEVVIKILSENKNSLLNKLVTLALADQKVKQQLANKEIGQFIVEPIHFDRKDYRNNLK